MATSNNVLSRQRYLSPSFLAVKIRERGLLWCALRGIKLAWQRVPSKLRSFLVRVLDGVVIIAAFPLVVLLYLFGIRILVNCRTRGMGHLAIEPPWFLARRALDSGSFSGKYYILMLEQGGLVANEFLIQLFGEHLIVFKSKPLNLLLNSISRYPFLTIDIGVAPPEGTSQNKDFTRERNLRHARMIKDIQAYRKTVNRAFLELSEETISKGRKNLEFLGIGKGDWFVCLHAGEVSMNGRYGYDLLRRQEISDYCEMIEYIAEIGGKVVRMGDRDVPDIQDGIPLINYPKSQVKSDWMDIFLISECKYYIGCSSGLLWAAVLFGKPLILTNIVTWHLAPGFDGDIYLPKMIRSKEIGELLSVREYVDKGFHLVHWDWEVPEPYEYMPNDGQDLINAVKEMEEYLQNGMPTLNELQERWSNSFPWKEISQPSGIRISSSFAAKWRDILFRNS